MILEKLQLPPRKPGDCCVVDVRLLTKGPGFESKPSQAPQVHVFSFQNLKQEKKRADCSLSDKITNLETSVCVCV